MSAVEYIEDGRWAVTFVYTKEVPIMAKSDVLVCGAGLAGIGAAVAAARGGARTMVVERNGFAGGFFYRQCRLGF